MTPVENDPRWENDEPVSAARYRRALVENQALRTSIESADRFSTEIADIDALLHEWNVPYESGGVELSCIGRVRALRSMLVVEANQLRTSIEEERESLREALEEIVNAGGPAWLPELEIEHISLSTTEGKG